jgi:FtsZ-interacting cell division protein YlmF
MSLVDKFKDWFLVDKNNQDTLEDEEEDFEDTESTSSKSTSKATTNSTANDTSSANTSTTNHSNDTYTSPSPSSSASSNTSYRRDYDRPSVSNSSPNSTNATVTVSAKLEVVLVRPEVFTDAKQIADHLIKKKTVVLNLENAKPENKRRIIDFLAGVAYANGGSIKAVANRTYIITPSGVGFVGDELVGELESSGVLM